MSRLCVTVATVVAVFLGVIVGNAESVTHTAHAHTAHTAAHTAGGGSTSTRTSTGTQVLSQWTLRARPDLATKLQLGLGLEALPAPAQVRVPCTVLACLTQEQGQGQGQGQGQEQGQGQGQGQGHLDFSDDDRRDVPVSHINRRRQSLPPFPPGDGLFFGDRLRSVPTAMFRVPWEYTTEFATPTTICTSQAAAARLTLHGINYRAQVTLNGVVIGSKEDVVGTFVRYDFDVTSVLSSACTRHGTSTDQAPSDRNNNALQVVVWPPVDDALPPANNSTDLAISFVDWSPRPPDRSMGLWQPVELAVHGRASLQHPRISTRVMPATPEPRVMVNVSVLVCLTSNTNTSKSTTTTTSQSQSKSQSQSTNMRSRTRTAATENRHTVVANVSCELGLGGVQAQWHVASIAPGKCQRVDVVRDLEVPGGASQLWWPWHMGNPTLHNLTFAVTTAEAVPDAAVAGTVPAAPVSDKSTLRYGLRHVTSSLDQQGHRLFFINGEPLFVAGAGWTPHLFLRDDPLYMASQLRYVKHMHLNTVRMEGKFESDGFYELADELGLLIMPGWCCCDAWQHWSAWGEEQLAVAEASLRSQLDRLASHPSVFTFLYGSDEAPPPPVEAMYLRVFAQQQWPNPVLASAANDTTPQGPTGVKMSGPYSWVPPNYWLQDTARFGGAFGFLTEGGPGENPLSMASLKAVLPESSWWSANKSMDNLWSFHCGNPEGLFGNLRFFTPPLEARYGNATGLEDYAMKAQVMAYEGHRAFLEAYAKEKFVRSTGVVQWMLNSPWPEQIWHLIEFKAAPTAAYFAVRRALEPVHVMLDPNALSVWIVVNTGPLDLPITVECIATVLTMSSEPVFVQNATTTVSTTTSQFLLNVPPLASFSHKHGLDCFFVRLAWRQVSVSVPDAAWTVSHYWQPVQPDVLDWEATNFYRTPVKTFATFHSLLTLPLLSIDVRLRPATFSDSGSVVYGVTVSNPALAAVAFFVSLRLELSSADGPGAPDCSNNGTAVTPVFWSDNYVTLIAGEARNVTARFSLQSVPTTCSVVVSHTCWNCKPSVPAKPQQ
eukprot:m.148818 g.148818  ORF g.148818 m.148818 type:complete len:1055 (-) comp17327_c0_seq2:139-3303(-)